MSQQLSLFIYLYVGLIEQIKVHWAVCDMEQLRSPVWLSPAGIQSGFKDLCPLYHVHA